jgi:GNAT superfamily N-acetyltransferase
METLAVSVSVLKASEAGGFGSMTFPAYRHLLSLEPSPRHLDPSDTRVIQPIALAAEHDSSPVGFALGEMPIADDHPPEILSVYVVPGVRGRGVAAALIAAMEEALRARGFSRVDVVYMTGKPGVATIERILLRRGWATPVVRTLTVKFTPAEAARTRWFARVRLPDEEFEIFSWSDLRPEERDEIARSDGESKWIAKGLEPWRHDNYGFDTVSSVGLRYHGAVVGWVINHRLTPDTVRFTCSFMRFDLSRRGRILPLYTESIRRLAETGCRECTLVTPLEYREMVDFLRRRCAEVVHFFGETRTSAKALA